MRMTLLWIVNIRVDSSFEDIAEIAGLCWLQSRSLAELHVEEGGNVSQIKYAGIAQLDWLLQEFLIRDHLSCDIVPDSPQVVPFIHTLAATISSMNISYLEGADLPVRGGLHIALALLRTSCLFSVTYVVL